MYLDSLNCDFGVSTNNQYEIITQYTIARSLGFSGNMDEWFTFILNEFPEEYSFDLIDDFIQYSIRGNNEWHKIIESKYLNAEESDEYFTITFVDENGVVLKEVIANPGQHLSIPNIDFGNLTNSEVEGYYFDGILWDFENYVVTFNMTIEVVMKDNGYSLQFITEGGILEFPMSNFDPEQPVNLPDCYKSGYTFMGWYLESGFINKVENTGQLSLDNHVLYAKFSDNNLTCAEDPTQEICSDPETWTWNYNRTNFDGKGMTIVIYHGSPEELDPFNAYFTGGRQKEKQAVLTTIELEYNVDIQIKAYPDAAAWGPSRVAWLNNNVASGNVQGDIYTIHSGWIPTLVSGGSIALLSNRKTGEGLFAELNYEQSAENNKLLSIGNDIYGYSISTTHADQFLYYNQSLVDQYGLEDPATLWNEGKWDWSTFYAYIQTAQNAFDSAVTGEDQYKIYAFGGFVNDIARGMLAARGGKLIDPDSKLVLFTSTLVLETYTDLRTIWQADMWALDSRSADVSESFRAGNQLFTHGNLWFLSSEQRFKNDQITFKISAVPYPTADGDAAARSYYSTGISEICYIYDSDVLFAIRPIENGVNGISTLVLLNILDDLMRGIRPEFSLEDLTEREAYVAFLQQRIESQASVDAIMSVEDNLANYAFIDYMDVVSKSVGNGCDWSGSGFGPWGISLVTGDEEPQVNLDAYKREYQDKLNEILNV